MNGVLVTRAADDAAELCARLEALGFVPVLGPLSQVTTRPVAPPPGVQAILVTSRNAVAALPPSATTVLAVGDATAERARAHGFAHVLSAGGDAVALAALAGERLDPSDGPLLIAVGAGQGASLVDALHGRGFGVVRRVCYVVRPVQHFPPAAQAAIGGRRLHAALFLSAQTAAIFTRLLPRECNDALTGVLALAIGTSTATALQTLPWRQIRRASAPTLDDVLALL